MANTFDPYHKWLGIPPKEQPANHYRLLGLVLFENDPEVIESAADRQMSHIRTFQAGRYAAESQDVLNALSAAKVCLLKPQQKAEYDQAIQVKLDAARSPPVPAAAPVWTPSRDMTSQPGLPSPQAVPVNVWPQVAPAPLVQQPQSHGDSSRPPRSSASASRLRRQQNWPIIAFVALLLVALLGVAGKLVWSRLDQIEEQRQAARRTAENEPQNPKAPKPGAKVAAVPTVPVAAQEKPVASPAVAAPAPQPTEVKPPATPGAAVLPVEAKQPLIAPAVPEPTSKPAAPADPAPADPAANKPAATPQVAIVVRPKPSEVEATPAKPAPPVVEPPMEAPPPARPGNNTVPREINLPNRGGSHGVAPTFMPDSARLLWFDGKGIVLWDLANERIIGSMEPAYWMYVMSSDGKTLATDLQQAGAPVIKIYDIATQRELHELSRPPDAVATNGPVFRTCGFDSKGTKLFTRTDVDVQVWEVKTAKMLRRIQLPRPPFNNGSAQSQNGRYLTIQCGQPHVLVLDTETEVLLPINASAQDLDALLGRKRMSPVLGPWCFSADGRKLYGSDQWNEAIYEWSLPDGTMNNGVVIPDMVFGTVSPDTGRILARYKTEKNLLRVLDSQTQRVIATLGPLGGDLSWSAISADNRWVFVRGGNDDKLYDFGKQAATKQPVTKNRKKK